MGMGRDGRCTHVRDYIMKWEWGNGLDPGFQNVVSPGPAHAMVHATHPLARFSRFCTFPLALLVLAHVPASALDWDWEFLLRSTRGLLCRLHEGPESERARPAFGEELLELLDQVGGIVEEGGHLSIDLNVSFRGRWAIRRSRASSIEFALTSAISR